MYHHQRLFLALSTLISCSTTVSGLDTQAGIVITPPPPQPTLCSAANPLKRQQSCSYGICGTQCLSQGAFCCGPAGTLATSPYWVCDNGICITSIRGSTGIVDCYDPDNPQGTTQSCIDNIPTTTCFSTDRCYTCSTDQPFCYWETYIETSPTTLRWFSCVATKIPDATFFAATITPPTSIPTTSSKAGSVISTGAIVGIAVGGGITLIATVAIIAWCCISIRKKRPINPPPQTQDQNHTKVAYEDPPTELPPETIHYEAEGQAPAVELPAKAASVGVMGQGKIEPQEEERRGYEITHGCQDNSQATEQELAHEREDEIVEEGSNRASYIEGDDWAHMSPGGVGVAR